LSAGGYYFGKQNGDNFQATITIAHTPTPTPLPLTTSQPAVTALPTLAQTSISPSPTRFITKNGIVLYEHLTAHYTLEYPASWKDGTEPEAGEQTVYENFSIKTVDYRTNGMLLAAGASLSVRVQDTNETSIENIINKYSIFRLYARNKTKATIDGVEAVQYDLQYEGVNTTTTTFIKHGKMYAISFRYVDAFGKQAEWNTYLKIIKSFRAK
jgi:hypothetical protein